jgi:hypothetical protein
MARTQDHSVSEEWVLLIELPPDSFTVVADLVGSVMEFCDSESLLRMRLVCRHWSSNRCLNWQQTFSLVKEARGRGERLSLRDAIARCETNSFDLIVDIAALRTIKLEPIVVEEHERYFPLAGFAKRRLPGDPPRWSQLNGPYRGEITDPHSACAGGHAWTGSWTPHVCGSTDVDGWQYALSYNTTFGPKKRPFVRRRQWIRCLLLGE